MAKGAKGRPRKDPFVYLVLGPCAKLSRLSFQFVGSRKELEEYSKKFPQLTDHKEVYKLKLGEHLDDWYSRPYTNMQAIRLGLVEDRDKPDFG